MIDEIHMIILKTTFAVVRDPRDHTCVSHDYVLFASLFMREQTTGKEE